MSTTERKLAEGLMPNQKNINLPVYLDCAATTPIDPRVLETVDHYLTVDFGNSGSHMHGFGGRAKKAVEHAREVIAAIVNASPEEVIFTSGATESNNIAILGLQEAAEEADKRHIVTTAIEHKAVLEPIERLKSKGFEVTIIKPTEGGWVRSEEVLNAVRLDTFLVSVMHVNNETGIIQPIKEIAEGLHDHPTYFHTDASQGFGKEFEGINHPRIDLISASGHKLYCPKGIGVLIARRRQYKRPPIQPLIVGGGQERGLRSGTLPVYLCAAFGKACEIMRNDHGKWKTHCESYNREILDKLKPLVPLINGDLERKIPCIINLSFNNIDSEALIIGLKEYVAISNGSACTTAGSDPSHVLDSMLDDHNRVKAATRWSWSHMTPLPPFGEIVQAISRLN